MVYFKEKSFRWLFLRVHGKDITLLQLYCVASLSKSQLFLFINTATAPFFILYTPSH